MIDILNNLCDSILAKSEERQLLRELEIAARQILGCEDASIRLHSPPLTSNPLSNSDEIPLTVEDGRIIGTLSVREATSLDSEAGRLFLKLAALALFRCDHLRVSRDLYTARAIIEDSLPKTKMQHAGWEISGVLKPASHVGGDTFAYRTKREDGFAFLLADAVGHGLDSTILASECRSLFRSIDLENGLGAGVGHLNKLLFEDTGPERFVAATLGYCHQDGILEYVSCGQSPLFLRRKERVELLTECEPPLGLLEGLNFPVQRVEFAPDDLLICVTDGILEWANESGDLFSEEGVCQIFSHKFSCTGKALNVLFERLYAFCRPTSQRDDACALAIRRLSNS